MLRVTEIYKSIQGESTWAGLPCVFVRLTGCPLRCVWCDTAYAFHGGESMSIADVVERVRALDCPLVELTGGEPLAQKECPQLAQALLDAGCTVLVETSGAEDVSRLPEGAVRIMDLKCPGSGECERNDLDNIARLNPRDEVKFVIADRADYEWSRAVVLEHRLHERCRAVLFSPVFGSQSPQELVEWMLADNLPARFHLQLHKFVWDPERKGV